MKHDKNAIFKVPERRPRPGDEGLDIFRHVNRGDRNNSASNGFLWDYHDNDCVKCLTDELFSVVNDDSSRGPISRWRDDIDIAPVEPLFDKDGNSIFIIEVQEDEIVAISPLELLAREG